MSFPWKIVAAGGLVLGATAFVVRTRSRSHMRPPLPARVALIGDSYAVGLGPELAKLFPGEFKFEGRVGTNTAQWASHSSKCVNCGDWISTFKPDLVLIALGVNDGNAPNVSNYQTIVRGLHGLGARVVWIQPPSDVWAPNVRNAIAALGVPTVPAPHAAMADDGLHPQSYVPWAREVAQAVMYA